MDSEARLKEKFVLFTYKTSCQPPLSPFVGCDALLRVWWRGVGGDILLQLCGNSRARGDDLSGGIERLRING